MGNTFLTSEIRQDIEAGIRGITGITLSLGAFVSTFRDIFLSRSLPLRHYREEILSNISEKRCPEKSGG